MTVAAVIVSWDEPEATAAALRSLAEQTVPLTEVVVVDNHPDHPAASSPQITGAAQVLVPPENLGFAGGVALGVRETTADWVLLLNPDATAAPDCLERLLAAAGERTGVVGAQILLPDGRTNAGDNPVHLTGITWAGRLGEPAESGPPRPVASVSGAAMLVRREAYDAIGGMNERYFLYHEDVELCWRMRLARWRVVFVPAATVEHDYVFDKGPGKWFFLERNRVWTVLSCYGARTLLLLAPVLLSSEAVILMTAIRGGWWREKLRAWRSAWRDRHRIAEQHRRVQGMRRVSDAAILHLHTAALPTAAASPGVAVRASGPALRAYRALLIRLLS